MVWQGQIACLQYTNDSKKLFFTTTLQNKVQSYSLIHARLMDVMQDHPSPPTVFVLSTSSQVLLSASPRPPIIYLAFVSHYSPPMLLYPQCSTSAVVAASFHPDRENIFGLAFADGTVAVYDAAQFFANRDRKIRSMGLSFDTEVGYITKVHATINHEPRPENDTSGSHFKGYDSGTKVVGLGSVACGTAAIAFVPTRKAMMMTVGADGRCCVIDFAVRKRESNNSSKIRIVRSWHLGNPATSLAVCPPGKIDAPSSPAGGRSSSLGSKGNKVLVAIGLQDGRVLIYNLEGELKGQRTFGSSTTRVVGVEWTSRIRSVSSRRKPPSHHPARPKRQSVSSVPAACPPIRKRIPPVSHSHESSDAHSRPAKSLKSGVFSTQRKQPEFSTSALNRLGLLSKINAVEPTVVSHPGATNLPLGHMDIFSPVPTSVSETTGYETAKEELSSSISLIPSTTQSTKESRRKGIIGTDGLNEQSSESTIVRTSQAPSIPPRPTPKPGGRLYLRRAQSSGVNLTYAHNGASRHSKSLGLMKNSSQKQEPKASRCFRSFNCHTRSYPAATRHILQINVFPRMGRLTP